MNIRNRVSDNDYIHKLEDIDLKMSMYKKTTLLLDDYKGWRKGIRSLSHSSGIELNYDEFKNVMWMVSPFLISFDTKEQYEMLEKIIRIKEKLMIIEKINDAIKYGKRKLDPLIEDEAKRLTPDEFHEFESLTDFSGLFGKVDKIN